VAKDGWKQERFAFSANYLRNSKVFATFALKHTI
jgi:hypothetical protein